MEVIRKRHKRTKEELKELFIHVLDDSGMGTSVQWNDFAFHAKSYGTTVKGEIFDDEVHVEITGWFAKGASQELRKSWKELVIQGLV